MLIHPRKACSALHWPVFLNNRVGRGVWVELRVRNWSSGSLGAAMSRILSMAPGPNEASSVSIMFFSDLVYSLRKTSMSAFVTCMARRGSTSFSKSWTKKSLTSLLCESPTATPITPRVRPLKPLSNSWQALVVNWCPTTDEDAWLICWRREQTTFLCSLSRSWRAWRKLNESSYKLPNLLSFSNTKIAKKNLE